MKKVRLRKDTYDDYIYNEIFVEGVYDMMEITEDDVVLDIGANVGFYAMKASETAKQVIAYEPESENYDQLLENTDGISNIVSFNRAIGFEESRQILYKSNTDNNGLHTLIPTPGFDKQAVNVDPIEEIIDKYKVTKIKCDCEGGEFNIFEGYKFPDHVTEIIGEGHVINDDFDRAEDLMDEMMKQFHAGKHTITPGMGIFNFYFYR